MTPEEVRGQRSEASTEPNIRLFKRLLSHRGMTINGLAAAIHAGRCHLSQVLNGKPNRGHFTRRKLAKILTASERAALCWDDDGNVSTERGQKAEVGSQNGMTILDLERAGKPRITRMES